MKTGGVGAQWTKWLVLESAVPPNVQANLDELFVERKTKLCAQRTQALLL